MTSTSPAIRRNRAAGFLFCATFLSCCIPSGAELLQNPGFERGTGTNASHWSAEGSVGTRVGEWWAHRANSGTNGASFYTQDAAWGCFSQDVPVSLSNGEVLAFRGYGKADIGYDVTNTTVSFRFYSEGSVATTQVVNLYSDLVLREETGAWHRIRFQVTNTVSAGTVTQVCLTVGYSNCTIAVASRMAHWDDLSLGLYEPPRPAEARILQRLEPLRGVYLGVLIHGDGGTATDINTFNAKAGKHHAVFGKFITLADGFPTNWVEMIRTNCPGSAVHIVLEPVNEFQDFYATNWGPGQATYNAASNFLRAFADAGIPTFIRFGHEANGSWYPWAPDYPGTDVSECDYIKGWRRFADLAHAVAPNVAMVWAPNQGGGFEEYAPQAFYEDFYPGDAYVDWVGMSLYNGVWYGNGSDVQDYQFRNAIQRGYNQEDSVNWNDTAVDFYWTFSDPDNPAGHHKPMMAAETSDQFNPKYAVSGAVAVVRFESMDGPQLATNSWGWVDACESVTNWSWGLYSSTIYFSNTEDRVQGTNAICIGPTATFSPGWWVGGSGHSVPADGLSTNWSTYNAILLSVKRAAGTNDDPRLDISFRGPWGETATVQCVISGTNYSRVAIPFSLFESNMTANFSWSNIVAVEMIMFTTNGGSAPAAICVDDLVAAHITNAADQEWWTPWGLTTWEQTTDAASGIYALRMGGTDDNSDQYIGGNGCALQFSDRDWTNANALVLYMKREAGPEYVRPNPHFKLTLDLDSVDGNNNEATAEANVGNSDWREIIIAFQDFSTTTGFAWPAATNLSQMKIELASPLTGGHPYDLYFDHIRRAQVVLTNGFDNIYRKQDWINQLYCLQDYSGPAEPDRVDLFRSFRNVHMVNWFQVRKFEDGETRDFTLPEFDGATPVCSSYYARVSDSYFLTGVVADADSDGLPDDWEQVVSGTATGAVATADPDGDGANHWEEYVAGTRTDLSNSVFSADCGTTGTSPASGFVLRWSSETGRVYTIDRASNMMDRFTTRQVNVLATPPINTYTDTVGTAEGYFYRMKIVP